MQRTSIILAMAMRIVLHTGIGFRRAILKQLLRHRLQISRRNKCPIDVLELACGARLACRFLLRSSGLFLCAGFLGSLSLDAGG